MRGLTVLVALAILSAFAPGMVSAQSVDPAILSVIVDGRKFLIVGRNLPTGSGRKVVIGEGLKLRIKPGATEDFIVARMPSGMPLLEPGTYRMVVQKLDTKVLFNVAVPSVDKGEETRYVWLPTADESRCESSRTTTRPRTGDRTSKGFAKPEFRFASIAPATTCTTSLPCSTNSAS